MAQAGAFFALAQLQKELLQNSGVDTRDVRPKINELGRRLDHRQWGIAESLQQRLDVLKGIPKIREYVDVLFELISLPHVELPSSQARPQFRVPVRVDDYLIQWLLPPSKVVDRPELVNFIKLVAFRGGVFGRNVDHVKVPPSRVREPYADFLGSLPAALGRDIPLQALRLLDDWTKGPGRPKMDPPSAWMTMLVEDSDRQGFISNPEAVERSKALLARIEVLEPERP
ncbi:MAG TPA: hypothetical protein VEY30_06575 [Myxococcaceae bacterium]|nr:hypothetical protein [Myxococcaceae bacterium]